jgi:hypothetical protein
MHHLYLTVSSRDLVLLTRGVVCLIDHYRLRHTLPGKCELASILTLAATTHIHGLPLCHA